MSDRGGRGRLGGRVAGPRTHCARTIGSAFLALRVGDQADALQSPRCGHRDHACGDCRHSRGTVSNLACRTGSTSLAVEKSVGCIMEVRPILSAMRRNKVGAALIGLQMAITLAILCNGLFIIEQRVAYSKRPTGADERNVFVIPNQWIGNPPDLAARLQADLAALRALPGVVDAFATNSVVLS